jgi:hypothetical protein
VLRNDKNGEKNENRKEEFADNEEELVESQGRRRIARNRCHSEESNRKLDPAR